ncbi:hypothetical protein AYO52_13185 [Dietzia sp. 111N12-1]|nr:hypothetical protein AYO52_13185 [Dietzia sp. 111N12-1]
MPRLVRLGRVDISASKGGQQLIVEPARGRHRCGVVHERGDFVSVILVQHGLQFRHRINVESLELIEQFPRCALRAWRSFWVSITDQLSQRREVQGADVLFGERVNSVVLIVNAFVIL